MAGARSRESILLDAAISVVARGGGRELTHRAVDTAAGLPEGSTSNMFRTRTALLAAVLGRVLERETSVWAAIAADQDPTDAPELATLLGEVIDILTGDEHELSRARRAVFTEALQQDSLATEIQQGRASLVSWMGPLLEGLGSPDPLVDVDYLLALIDGLIGARLTDPTAARDPSLAITALLRGLSSTA